MIDQAFHAAQAFRQSKQVRVLKKTSRSGEISFQNDGDHSAKPAHLLPGQIVLWMRFQSGIMDRFDLALVLEPARNLQRV